MGYLLFPRNYDNYKQMNVNLYCEFLGQQSTDIKASYIDIAPAVQLIFNSSTRFNLGARYQLAGNAHRMAERSVFISLEHYFLNALKWNWSNLYSYFFSPFFERKIVADKRSLFIFEQAFLLTAGSIPWNKFDFM